MSTKLHDVAAAAVLAPSVAPATVTSSQNGSAVDLIAGDGNAFAVLVLGTVAGGTTVGGKVQESADGSTGWADIAGAAFPNVTTGNAAYTVTFERTQRYARCVVTVSGGSPSAAVCAAVGQQKKVI
jgi:hypothetical protein